MENPTYLYSALAFIVVSYLVRWYRDPLRAIPTVGGYDLPILSYGGAFRWLRHGREMLQEGYEKHYGTTFKVPMLDRWLVIVTGSKLVEEVRRRPDDELSNLDGLSAFAQTKYTLGAATHQDPYHVEVIRDKLTRGLPTVFPDVIDELTLAIGEHIPIKDNNWVSLPYQHAAQNIVARASGRVFVGLPLCRDEGYLRLSLDFTMSVVKDRAIINLFPDFFKPVVGRMVSNVSASIRQAVPYLAPVIDERRRLMEQHGDDWADKPATASRDFSTKAIIQRMLVINFAAIHTSSSSITHAIYHLAERPELLKDLREEIEPLVKEEGWTKGTMGKMWRLDSFLRESQRQNGINIISLMRGARKDVTLDDGTFIPKGTLLAVPVYSMHHDDALYADADAFDPFRFARMRERDGEGAKHQYVNTSIDYISFGHGKHACPGRFFAANELKAMLAYMVLNYDMKLPGDGKRPKNLYLGPTVVASPTAEVLFRKRQAAGV
ncbi:cytochrome P450 [Trametes gibbosa]|nr:cytochrome P450 [Trametes gibbosa]